ncbi:MAG: leucine-rich repeat domain-containing protein [Eubacterium sp.]|nr:leucine-rich repeat domain-containing protein [Eubacterium sp.]
MKKIILAMALTMVSLFGIGGTEIQGKSIEINEDTFPDNDFQMYVSYAFDTNQDGKLSDAERNAVKEINIGRSSEYQLELEYNSATSVKGIEYFPNLEKLDCSENIIEKLDVSKLKNLKELRCFDNNISKLNVKNNIKLKLLYCGENKISKIDLSKNKNLQEFYARENKISKIDISKNSKLKFLSVSENKIQKLDLKKQKKLEDLYCAGNKIKELNLKYNKNLVSLDCRNNKIEKLDLAHLSKLYYLHCSNNKLRKLDLRNNKLIKELYCKNNNLVSGNLHVSFTQLEDCEYKNQRRTIKAKKIGKYYYVPIKNLNRTNVVTNLSAGKITDKGIRLKGKKIPKKITYQYDMFTDGDKETKVTIIVKK